ncbi:heme/hemopexin-binding protein [Acrasis kona]|uniref:Heme/hemopexin-binding protein n=1 Tax=Acrasis kona TaxID=1008807 RepID=A0AAW2YZX1_9EUKA
MSNGQTNVHGYDGPRMHRLRETMYEMYSRIINEVPFDQIMNTFQSEEYQKLNRNRIYHLYKLCIEKNMVEGLKAEFHKVATSQNLREKLNNLDLHVCLDDGTIVYPSSDSNLPITQWRKQTTLNKTKIISEYTRLLELLQSDNDVRRSKVEDMRLKLQDVKNNIINNTERLQMMVAEIDDKDSEGDIEMSS